MDTKKYGIEWKKVQNHIYRIFIPTIIVIPKPKFEIVFEYDSSSLGDLSKFDPSYLSIDWKPFETTGYRIQNNKVFLNTEVKYLTSQILRYQGNPIDWSFQGGFDTDRIYGICDQNGKLLNISNTKDRPNEVEIELKGWIKNNEPLSYADGSKVEYNIKTIDPYRTVYYDSLGELPVNQVKYDNAYFLHTSREIHGKLKDIDNDIHINYKKLTPESDEIWIELTDNSSSEDVISAGTSITELFIELLTSAEFQEIYDGSVNKNNSIRVYKINFEEYTLLVEKLPTQKIIYPPKNDSQLRKQKWALSILKDYPSPYHRGLLKLFETVQHVKWEPLKKSNKIDWKFLIPDDKGELRQGTDMQREFVERAMQTPDFAILEGPPGSGKTTSLTELIYQLILDGNRILLSASTNVAIDNIIEKLIEQFGNESNLKDHGIVPLRIGREERLDKTILPFQIDNRKERLFNILSHDASMKELLSNNDVKDKYLEEMVIRSSNLVCGTTIGILQYPNFRKNKEVGYIEPEFDYLIIDEASKTTIPQFLVPAINAKRWIIAGDIKQLSPYMETLHIRVSLKGLLGEDVETALLLYFVFIFDQSYQRNFTGHLPKYIVPVKTPVIFEFLKIIFQLLSTNGEDKRLISEYQALKKMKIATLSSREINISNTNNGKIVHFDSSSIQQNFDKMFKLISYDLILVSEQDFNRLKSYLPATHLILSTEISDAMIKHLFKHEYWYHASGKPYFIFKGKNFRERNYDKIRDDLLDSVSRNWAGQLSWRLSRVYELEEVSGTSSAKKYYQRSMHALTPQTKEHKKILNDIKRMGQIFFPSILKCIQVGIKGEYKIAKNNTVLSKGMEKQAFSQRHVLLKYQHRMHDTIAEVPRDLFYSNTTMSNASALQTSNSVDRTWPRNVEPFPRLTSRMSWLHVTDTDYRNRNDREADLIIRYIKKLVKWINQQDESHRWSLAVLSYYNKQREVIVKRIKEEFKSVNQRAKTHFDIDKLHIMVYTVDKIQGREADFVFISMVRNSKLGFMDSPNRLNVAITRAKYLVIIFGNADFFKTCDSTDLRKLVKTLQKRQSVFIDKEKDVVQYAVGGGNSRNRRPRNFQRRGKII